MIDRDAGDLEALLDAARRGEESGVAGLWRALNPLVLRYLRVVVGQAADDVASETWLRAAHELRQFRGDATGFRIWLFRVARHRALEELRRSGRRREDPAGLYGVDDRVSRDDPAREAVERMATRRALRLIADLPANQAEAVMLRVVVGMDVAQTAAVLGKRPGAVRVASMRGLRRLATVIGDNGLDGGDVLDSVDVDGVKLGRVDLDGVRVDGADLDRADLDRADLDGASFGGADLHHANGVEVEHADAASGLREAAE